MAGGTVSGCRLQCGLRWGLNPPAWTFSNPPASSVGPSRGAISAGPAAGGMFNVFFIQSERC